MTTYHLLLAAHLILAVFIVGPLVHAATTAGRGVRTGDGKATASASRVLRIYAYASVLILVVGFPLMSQKPFGGRKLGDVGDTYIWLSIALWAVAIALVLGLIVPTLDRATKSIESQESVVALIGRIAAAGGIVGLLFATIIVLMTFRPGR